MAKVEKNRENIQVLSSSLGWFWKEKIAQTNKINLLTLKNLRNAPTVL